MNKKSNGLTGRIVWHKIKLQDKFINLWALRTRSAFLFGKKEKKTN